MARKNYTDRFRRRAVDLYEATPGTTLRGIANDLGLAPGTFADWARTLGTGSTTTAISSPRARLGRPDTTADRVACLEAEAEAEVAVFGAEEAKLKTEKTILRQPARHLAADTNW